MPEPAAAPGARQPRAVPSRSARGWPCPAAGCGGGRAALRSPGPPPRPRDAGAPARPRHQRGRCPAPRRTPGHRDPRAGTDPCAQPEPWASRDPRAYGPLHAAGASGQEAPQGTWDLQPQLEPQAERDLQTRWEPCVKWGPRPEGTLRPGRTLEQIRPPGREVLCADRDTWVREDLPGQVGIPNLRSTLSWHKPWFAMSPRLSRTPNLH